MQHVSLAILYEPADGGKPYRVARVKDAGLIRQAAQVAVDEARLRAQILAQADSVLSAVEAGEASKLERVFSVLVPEIAFADHATAASGVM